LSKAVWAFENYQWGKVIGGDAAAVGSGPGSYNIRQSVWHVNCCNAEINGGGGWGIFNAILGWENSATYGTVISYNLYWICVMIGFGSLRYYEKNGHYPFMKVKAKAESTETGSESDSQEGGALESSFEMQDVERKGTGKGDGGAASSTVRELTV